EASQQRVELIDPADRMRARLDLQRKHEHLRIFLSGQDRAADLLIMISFLGGMLVDDIQSLLSHSEDIGTMKLADDLKVRLALMIRSAFLLRLRLLNWRGFLLRRLFHRFFFSFCLLLRLRRGDRLLFRLLSWIQLLFELIMPFFLPLRVAFDRKG